MNNPLHKNPLVSIVMATYNGEKFLAEQIQSICKQSYPNFELIICDDCSSDNTQELIKSFAIADKRIQFHFNNENKGLNKNFESAILKANGAFICIADQDDVWIENKIEKLLECFTENKVVLAHSQSVAFSSAEPPLLSEVRLKKIIMMSGSDSRKLLLKNSISGHNMMFRKELVSEIIPIPSGIYYDWWISMMATTAGAIKDCPLILTFHRHHSANLTQKNKKASRQQSHEFEERKRALTLFRNISKMSASAKSLNISLLTEWEKMEKNKFSFSLFCLLMKNAAALYYYKTKKIRLFSFLKAAYRMSQIV